MVISTIDMDKFRFQRDCEKYNTKFNASEFEKQRQELNSKLKDERTEASNIKVKIRKLEK